MLLSPGFSVPAEKKQKKVEKEVTTSKAKSCTDKPAKSGSDSRSVKAPTDASFLQNFTRNSPTVFIIWMLC